MSVPQQQPIGLSMLLLFLAACGGDSGTNPPPTPVPGSISISAGNGQSAASGAAVSVAPAVIVRDAQGAVMAGVKVQFTVTAGGGAVAGSAPLTDASGIARVTSWTLGPSGDQRLSAQVGSLTPVVFQATLLPGNNAIEVTVPVGGTYEITTPDHPYRGLKLTARPGALTNAGRWQMEAVTNAPPLTLPPGFTAAGPRLRVTTEQDRANGLLLIDVPVDIPAGRTVVIALRDPLRGVMEVLPTISRTATSVRVATTHLRSDLLVGPGGAGSSLSARIGTQSIAELIPIQMLLPLPDVAPTMNPGADRWPVLDYGSALEPDGHGIAIPMLTALNRLTSSVQLALAVRPLEQPGFYAEGAPLAAIVKLSKDLAYLDEGVIEDLEQQLALVDKPQRDQFLMEATTANLALQGPVLVAVAKRTSRKRVYAAAYATSGSGTSVTYITPGQLAATSHLFSEASGFAARTVPTTADGPTVTSTGVVPLNSTVIPYERAHLILANLQRMATASFEERADISESMSIEAGLPATELEQETEAGKGWYRVQRKQLVLRSKVGTIRLTTPADLVVHNYTTGSQDIASPSGSLNAAAPFFQNLPQSPPRQVTVSRQQMMLQGLRQMSAATYSMMRGDFEVTPDELEMPEDRKVELTPKVPMPPTEGFRIRWQWGDQTTTETTNAGVASHTYEQPGNYQVIASLLSTTNVLLGADTVEVGSGPMPYWRLVTAVDADELLDDEEIEGGGQEYQMLKRMVTVPGAAMISIEDGPGGKGLYLRVRKSGTWPDGIPGPYNSGNEWRMVLGPDTPQNYPLGPYFSAWRDGSWSQSTTTLTSGTVLGQNILGMTSYNVPSAGTQTGPAGGVRFNANRNGTTMSGVLEIWIWFVDYDDNEVGPGEQYPFLFTAVRMQ